jgi:hypothetical protein
MLGQTINTDTMQFLGKGDLLHPLICRHRTGRCINAIINGSSL